MNAVASGRATPAVLLEAILDPGTLSSLDAPGWERLLSCARRNAVLAYVAERASAAGMMEGLPEFAKTGLLSARTSAARLAQLARWELDRVRRALRAARITRCRRLFRPASCASS